jgi:hypothetical protein
MLFRLLFSFQRPSRLLRQTLHPTRTGSTCQPKFSRFFRKDRSVKIDPKESRAPSGT